METDEFQIQWRGIPCLHSLAISSIFSDGREIWSVLVVTVTSPALGTVPSVVLNYAAAPSSAASASIDSFRPVAAD